MIVIITNCAALFHNGGLFGANSDRIDLMIKITKEQARRFLLRKNGLLGEHIFAGKEGALKYMRSAGCIQYDPVDICGKNAELTLQSRVRNFSREMLAEMLYKDRTLIDYYDKQLSIFPIEDWKYFSSYREKSVKNREKFPEVKPFLDETIGYIEKNGAVRSDELPIDAKIVWQSAIHWSGSSHKKTDASRAVLEQLYTEGALIIYGKSGSRKSYDIASRHLSAEIISSENPLSEGIDFIKWRICRRIGAVGMLWNRNSDAFLGIGMTSDERQTAFEQLVRERRISEVRVDGIKQSLYILREDEALLGAEIDGSAVRAENEKCENAAPHYERLEFLAPLDPMLWDRKLVAALWGFEYSWEIYTPESKRRFGYYVLPVLCGEHFVGRIEAQADRKNGMLIIKNLWFEDGVRGTKNLLSAVRRAAKRLAEFNGCAEGVLLNGENKRTIRQ